jgi:Fic/DOC family.
MDNCKLAEFLVSLGSLNGFSSTLAETKRALDFNDASILKSGPDDAIIFADALSGIRMIQSIGFSVDGIIAINKSFKSGGNEQPTLPGHLRNATYNVDDNISVITDETTQDAYFPKEVITREDLQDIVNEWNNSFQEGRDAWLVFARLSKLQAFQDGNKRTALIAANAAFGSLDSQDYLLIPTTVSKQYIFTGYLMEFYTAKDTDSELQAFNKMMEQVNDSQLTKSVFENIPINIRAAKTKPFGSI